MIAVLLDNVREKCYDELEYTFEEWLRKIMIIDMHTHLLPGIDDGARDWDVCLRMLSKSVECGVQKIIATPHYSPWDKHATAEIVCQLCKEAEKQLKMQYGVDVDIYPGHEIYYSVGVVDALKDGKALSLAGSRYVLLEFDPETSYQVFYHAVREFRDGGYVPILAHVERYRNLRKTDKIEQLKDGGALLQLNVGALQGGIMDSTSRWAKTCLRNEMIDFLASDMHNMRTRGPLLKEQLEWVQNKLRYEYREKILCGNSQNVIADKRQ